MSTQRGGRWIVMAAWWLSAAATGAVADEVKIESLTLSGVRVVDVGGGRVNILGPGGGRAFPLYQLTGIKLDRYPQLQEADQAMAAGDFARAYELLNAMVGGAADTWVRIVAGPRMVACLDRTNRFAEAVALYIDLLKADQTAYTLSASPQRLPADAALRARLAEQIGRSIGQAISPEVRQGLEELRQRVLPPPASADASGAPHPDPDAAPATAARVQADPIEQLIAAGRHAQALQQIEQALKSPGAPLSRLFYQRGLCEAAMGPQREMDALVSFMRVVIHFQPGGTQWHTPSLVEAGKIFAKRSKADLAHQVWTEARRNTGGDAALAEEIDRLLQSLSRQ